MSVFERIGRMVRADAHGVMDQLEERSLVLRQHLREAEDELARKQARLEAIDEERRQLAEEGRRQEERVAALDADVGLALESGDRELARFAVRRLLPQRAALSDLFARAARLDAERARLAERLDAQEARLAELRPQVRARLSRPTPVADPITCVTDEEVELELLRRRNEANTASEETR
jgi:phage shock protein A